MAGFQTSARTVDMLGRQQIAGIPTAMSELFKNAYDAYATIVRADYFRAAHVLMLRDDGVGMSHQEFLTRWLTIGTDSKTPGGTQVPIAAPAGQQKRQQMGEKGIGRLAIASIAPLVFVTTKSHREPDSATVALVPWALFEVPGLTLGDIDVPVESVSPEEALSERTLLRLTDGVRSNIKKLRKQQSADLFGLVERQLADAQKFPMLTASQLEGPEWGRPQGSTFFLFSTNEDLDAALESKQGEVAPFQRFLSGFTNSITRPAEESAISTQFVVHAEDGSEQDLISPHRFWSQDDFRNVDHVIHGKFDETGLFVGEVGVYQGSPVPYTLAWGRVDSPRCGSFGISLGILQGSASESRLPADEFAIMQTRLGAQGGLYIYRDGIRVLPYGNSDVDYLEIEKRRTFNAGRAFFSHRRIFGALELTSSDNPNLQEKAGREGFRENGAYRDFVGILTNFLTHVAADFFVRGGESADEFENQRERLSRRSSSRAEKERVERKQRLRFADQVERMLEVVERGDIVTAIHALEVDIDAMIDEQAANAPTGSWAEVEDRLARESAELAKKLTIRRPPGLALTLEIERQLDGLQALHDEMLVLLDDVIDRLSARVARYGDAQPGALGNTRRRRFDEARAVVAQTIVAEERATEAVLDNVVQIVRDEVAAIATEVESEVGALWAASSTVVRAEELLRLERTLAKIADEGAERITATRQSIERLAIDSDLVLDNRLLQERVLDLEEQSDSSVELMQLGLTVQIVNHEFEASIASVRQGLRRLQPWARANPDLELISRDLRTSFQSLDGYLRLFTPLQRRLYRSKVDFTGNDLLRFARGVFDERLERHSVRLSATDAFRSFAINGYPSSFYPVIVNLVDNAIYWISTSRAAGGSIKLGVDGACMTIADNGPGISPRDATMIFERGFSRRRGGRGLGLALSAEILEREGWTLGLLQNASGPGATFTIRPEEIGS